MEFNDVFRLEKPPVPVIEFRLGQGDNVQIAGSRSDEYWELPFGVDVSETKFLKLNQTWLDFFMAGDILQVQPDDRMPGGFFDVVALRLPDSRVWVGHCHQLPGDLVLLRAGQTLAGALTYRLDQVEVLGRVLRCFRGVTTRVGRKQKT